MRIIIDRAVLAQAANRAASIADKSGAPIGAAALLHVNGAGQLLVTARDTVCTFVGLYPVDVVSDQLRVCVDASRLRDVASVLPAGSVTMTLRETMLEVAAGRSTFKLPTLPTEEFPPTAQVDASACTITVSAADLRRGLRAVSHAMADDDSRYMLGGVHLELVQGALGMVTTDGSRLARVEVSATHQGDLPRRSLFPRRGAAELLRLLGDVEDVVQMKYGDKVVHIHWGAVASLYVRLLEADFPSYKEVLPATHKHRFIVDRDAVGNALKRVKLAARDNAKAVRFSFGSDGLVLSATQADVMSARDEVPCEADTPLSLGLNAAFIGDALAACPEGDVVMKSGGAIAPLILEPRGDASAFYVVMPVRLD